MSKCKGYKKNDTRCTRQTKNTSGYCYQHTAQETKKYATKYERLLEKGPTAKDEKGYIYVYRLLRDEREELSYWKIGRTSKTVKKRLSQWKGSVLKEYWEVPCNKLAEKLIHWQLRESRIYRYEYEKGNQKAIRYHSVYKSTGKVIPDSQNRAKDIENGTWKAEGRKKHVEWFVGSWKDIRSVIEQVVEDINKI